MEWWYSEQLRQYRLQFVRAFSNFYVKFGAGTANEVLQQVPCRYGEQSRIAASIVSNNSESKIPTTPFITCYITGIGMASERRQNPYLDETLQVNERKYDAENQHYTGQSGNKYTINRYMPVPYTLTFEVTMWTNNIDIREQLLEQILVLYNPAIDFQTSTNPIDWTMLTYIEMNDSITWDSVTIPIGTENPIDITSMQFKVPIWISPPAKVKKQVIIEEIITSVYSGGVTDTGNIDWCEADFLERIVTTPGDYSINIDYISSNRYELSLTYAKSIIDTESLPTITFSSFNPELVIGTSFKFNDILLSINTTSLSAFTTFARSSLSGTNYSCELYNKTQLRFINYSGGDNVFVNIAGTPCESMGIPSGTHNGNTIAWWRLIEKYGKLREYSTYGSGASQIRLISDSVNLATSANDIAGWLQYDSSDQNKMLWFVNPSTLPSTTLPAILAVINPENVGPGIGLPAAVTGQCYLLLEKPASESYAWGTIIANANDIITFDGVHWGVTFDSSNVHTTQYVTNLFNNKILAWHNGYWQNYFPTSATPGKWRLSL